MNEDDTFKVLSRIPFHEVKEIMSDYSEPWESINGILMKYNWTIDDYIIEILKS